MTIAMILAGGYGKRLRPLTLEVPKPLVKVAGKPVMFYQLEWLKYYGINEVVILAGYLKEKIIETIGSGSKFGLSVSYVIEDDPLGTGGALRNAAHMLRKDETIIVINGDILTNIDPNRLIEKLESEKDLVAVIGSVPLRSPYGILDIDEEKMLIRGFKEKPILREYWINAGVYAFRPNIVDYLPEKGDIEKTTFPELAENRKLGTVKYDTPPYYWRSIDTHKDLEEAAKELESIGGLLPVKGI
ncbi:MAG: nucleotidyltransferase family protein [Desulfurococcales archaeon]|nr:nucleotidyltransferase family protein [Desulfurococcales archaeon]